MTVYQNLKEMLELAIQCKRPAAEVANLRAELAKFEPQDLQTIKAKQAAFLRQVAAS